MIRRFIFICVLAAGFLNLSAQESDSMPQHLKNVLSMSSAVADTTAVEAEKNGQLVVLPDGTLSDGSDEYGKVVVGNDTISVILPGKNYSRYDRGLYNHLFMPKGKWGFGITASYGEFDTEDVQVLSFLKDFNFNGTTFSINPHAMYFFRSNQAAGVRLGYSKNSFNLESLSVDFDEDINFSLKDVVYSSKNYTAAIFYRYYVGLDNNRRFAIYNETDLSLSSGYGKFVRYYNEEPRDTRTNTMEVSLNFSPGLCVFMHELVSFNVSFGVFGFYFKNEKQKTNNEEEGKRFSSGASFKFNIFNINMGIAVHI